MALIAALLPKAADRSALTTAARDHGVAWARSWRELDLLVKQEPVTAAVADLHAERGKDGVLRVFRFTRRYPLTPIVIWGELDGRDLYRLGKARASDVLISPDTANGTLVRELIGGVTEDALAERIDDRLRERVGAEARDLVRLAASLIPRGVQVPELASVTGMSVSTLERRCERWGLPTPGHLLLWLRIVYGLNWLLEPGRSVESVARQLGYSSGAAFRRAIKVTVGGRPTPLRNAGGVAAALDGFLAACPGAAATVKQEV